MKIKLSVLTLSIFIVSAGYVFADQDMNQKGSMMEKMDNGSMMMKQKVNSESTSKAVEVGNKICPASGDKVGEMGKVVQYEYNGKMYNLCCPMCVKDFKKNPEKYSKIAEEEAAKSDQNEQK